MHGKIHTANGFLLLLESHNMLVISHRANINGIDADLENNPSQILVALKRFDVEVDVWFIDGRWFLGHDKPDYLVGFEFFNNRMWLHCKNLSAVNNLRNTSLNWFWHEQDKMTLTSHGYIWCYPKNYVESGIVVEFGYNADIPKNILGVCTDYPLMYKE